MQRIFYAFAGALFLALSFGSHSFAADNRAKRIGSFDEWEAFVQMDGKVKTCFAVARPDETEPKSFKRGDAYITISHRPADKVHNEIDLVMGFPIKREAPVDVEAGKAKFKLTVFDQKDVAAHAYAATPEQDTAIVEALAKTDKLVVKAFPLKGPVVTDSYFLKGAGKALKAIGDACK